ncbi:FH1/FH2 domain-containing protein 3 [Halotydeus destructor]|nr:FH1/FH2 domain-containing protein 3 [Halotydeus destructor]
MLLIVWKTNAWKEYSGSESSNPTGVGDTVTKKVAHHATSTTSTTSVSHGPSAAPASAPATLALQQPMSPKNWAPISNASSSLASPTKESISGSSIGVKNIQEQLILNTQTNNNNNNNNCDQSSNKCGPPPLKGGTGAAGGPSWHDPVLTGAENRGWNNTTRLGARPLAINDLDFSDLRSDDDADILSRPPPPLMGSGGSPVNGQGGGGGGPPPPPLLMLGPPPCPPPFMSACRLPGRNTPPPPPLPASAPPSGLRGPSNLPLWMQQNRYQSTPSPTPSDDKLLPCKNKKTVKLFWKEVKEDKSLLCKLTKNRTIWDELRPVAVDTVKLEHLFENRSKELVSKKQQLEGKKTELIFLGTKRSNAINIGMTRLPPPHAIRAAIMRMDATIINREGIDKILSTMMPTEEEKNTLLETQAANPDIPLGSAENFLLTLAQISALEARLKLWAFRLDYDFLEKECAEQLMDLKQSMEQVEKSDTLRLILATLLAVGNFLNGCEAKGFSLDYLAKVPEVKDTVHKHSLLYHLCQMILEKYPLSGDLYSELGAVTRASRVDYDEMAKTLAKMDADCKASWEHLKVIVKHDGALSNTKSRMSEFLANCAERINVLTIVQRRVHNRFKKLLVYLGFSGTQAKDLKPNQVLKTISEFALEYRTTRARVKEQMDKQASQRERTSKLGQNKVIQRGSEPDRPAAAADGRTAAHQQHHHPAAAVGSSASSLSGSQKIPTNDEVADEALKQLLVALPSKRRIPKSCKRPTLPL